MKRAIYPLYAPADDSKARPILDALRAKGFTLRDMKADPGKGDALLLFLSENMTVNGLEAEAFFRLSAGRELVIPVNLDGCTPPEELQNALMARHALDGTKYSADELAERIARAAEKERKNRLPLILSLAAAVILLVVGGILLSKNRSSEPPAAEATAAPTPAPTAAPTAEPALPGDIVGVDPATIVEVVYVGDEFRYYVAPEGVSPREEAERHGWNSFAYGGWYDDGIRFYSKADGHEYPLYAPADIEWLTMLPNLQYLSLCGVQTELPDLSGLPLLQDVHLGYSRITSLEGLRGSAIRNIEYHGAGVEDFSPLTSCSSLQVAHLDLVGSPRVDLTGFHPPELTQIGFGSGYNVEEVDFSCLAECPKLQDLSIEGFPQIRDLSFLGSADRLDHLGLQYMDGLTDLSGLEGAKALSSISIRSLSSLATLNGLQDHEQLTFVDIDSCGRLRDITGLAGCKRLDHLYIGGTEFREGLRDVSVLGTLTGLTTIRLYGVNIDDLDFLKTLKARTDLDLGVTAPIRDFSGLEGIKSFAQLDVSPENGDFGPWAEHLEGKTVKELQIDDARGLDLSSLPRVTGDLTLVNCDIRDLVGIGDQVFATLALIDCQYLASLEGFGELRNLGYLGTLVVQGCPRLTDWSALEGRKLDSLQLRGVYSLPDLSKITLRELRLESISAEVLPDLSCLNGMNVQKKTSFRLLDLDQITGLQPLFCLQGYVLQVPPQVEEQARELVESGRFASYEIVYPDGSWQPYTGTVSLLGWEDLTTLPKSVLKRVRTLTIAGDVLVNEDTTDAWEDWVDGKPVVRLKDRTTGEETIVSEMGTRLKDLSELGGLTGLEYLGLYYQPLIDLEGIQALEDLKALHVKCCPAFTDASAAFTVQSLERVDLSYTGLASVQGVQNLPALRELYINNTPVRDFSPLEGLAEDLQIGFDMPELMTLEELRAMPAFILDRIDNIAIAGDWAYWQWDPWWIGNEDQGDGTLVPTLFKNGSDEKMAVEMGHITDLSELSFLSNLRELKLYRQPITDLSGAAALEKLEGIDIGYCNELTDPTPLFALPNLWDVNFNDTQIASIQGIEQMQRLTSLAIAYCEVTDMSPLEKVDYTFCLQEENGGGFNLEVMKPREDPVFTAEDYAPLAAIPAFGRLDVSWVPAALWLDAVQNAPVKQLNAQCGTFTGNEELAAFAAAHSELEEIQITFNERLTDISCLLGLKRLRYVEVSDNMQQAIASLGEGYAFELNVRPW